MDPSSIIKALAALAQEHRLAVYRLLVQAGPVGLPAGNLADRIGVPPSSMSFHLAQLANAGLVTQRRQSRSIIYSADYDAMNGVMDFLTENKILILLAKHQKGKRQYKKPLSTKKTPKENSQPEEKNKGIPKALLNSNLPRFAKAKQRKNKKH